MIKLKAYFLFVLFCASTVSSFATVHRCEGKITDFELFTIAECDEHEEVTEAEQSCHDKCCKAEESDEEPCCDTSQLNQNDSDLAKTVIQNVVFNSELKQQEKFSFNTVVLIPRDELRFSSYSPPPIILNLQVKIQCFRI